MTQAARWCWAKNLGICVPGTRRRPAGAAPQQVGHLHVGGVEERDDGDGDQVVHDRERQQEDPQGAGQVRADDGQDRDGEGDVRGGRDRPAAQGFRAGAQVHAVTKTRAGTATPPTAAAIGTTAVRGIAQVARDELALELEAGQEEEDRQQPVGRPVSDAEVQVQGLDADLEVAQAK